MKMLLAFLNIVLPQVPQMAALFKAAFTRVGGKEKDFDRILADNQIDIDRLADPDSFRHKPAATEPPHPSTGDHSADYDYVFHSQPADALFKVGDRVMRTDDSSLWRVEAKDAPLIGWGGNWQLDHVIS